MKKKFKPQEPYIYLVFGLNGKVRKIKAKASQVREILNATTGEEVTLNFFVGKEGMVSVPAKRAGLEAALLQSVQIPIVPEKINKYLIDITWAIACKNKRKLVGREYEIEKAWSSLGRDSRCNVFFVGDSGVGKNAIVCEMARRIAKGEAPAPFLGYRIIKFKPMELMKESTLQYKFLLSEIEKFVANSKDKVILYIENIVYMKYNESLMYFLYDMINKWNIKLIGTAPEEHYEEYFISDFEISKYLNKVEIREPELKDVYPMIETDIKLLKKQHNMEISDEVVKFAIYTAGLCEIESASPGNIISVLKWAFSNARRNGKDIVEREDVLACYNTDLQLFEKTDPEEKERIAYHEIGHYIMHRLCENVKNEEVAFVSILPMMDFLGVNWTYYVKGKQLNYSRRAYVDMIKIYLGGRAAEDLFSGEYADGASSDLEVANSLAEALIMNYGLSNEDKQVNRSYTASGYYLKDYLFSDSLREEINQEIKSIIDNAYNEVKKAVEDNKELIDLLVGALLEHEILTGEELEAICNFYAEHKTKKPRRKTSKTKKNN